jgi:hypothetical protein
MVPDNNRIAPIAMRRKPSQFGPSPRNPTPRRGGSRVLRTGPEREEPLSDPRQITARTMYKTPPKTSSAPSPMTNILVSRFIAATNAPTTTRRNTATEPRFKPERLDSFLRNESGFPKSRRAFGKENATAKKSIIAVASAAGSHFATQCLRSGQRGHRQYIDRHRSTGPARGTWNTKQRLDPATQGSDEHSNSRKHQSQPFTKEFDTANKCDSKECAGVSEIIAAR